MHNPIYTEPVSRERSPVQRRGQVSVLSRVGSGVNPSQFGINFCDFLPEPARTICHAIGRGIGTE